MSSQTHLISLTPPVIKHLSVDGQAASLRAKQTGKLVVPGPRQSLIDRWPPSLIQLASQPIPASVNVL